MERGGGHKTQQGLPTSANTLTTALFALFSRAGAATEILMAGSVIATIPWRLVGAPVVMSQRRNSVLRIACLTANSYHMARDAIVARAMHLERLKPFVEFNALRFPRFSVEG